MSTRCVICLEEDGRYKGTYCRWDGYPRDAGMILLKAYSDRTLLDRLISLGGISTLHVSIDGTSFLGDGRWPKTAEDPADLMEDVGADYAYVFGEDGRWTMRRYGVPESADLLAVLREECPSSFRSDGGQQAVHGQDDAVLGNDGGDRYGQDLLHGGGHYGGADDAQGPVPLGADGGDDGVLQGGHGVLPHVDFHPVEVDRLRKVLHDVGEGDDRDEALVVGLHYHLQGLDDLADRAEVGLALVLQELVHGALGDARYLAELVEGHPELVVQDIAEGLLEAPLLPEHARYQVRDGHPRRLA